MAGIAEVTEALCHLKIPSSHIDRTGVELGNSSYGIVFEVDYCGKLCAVKEVHSLLLQLSGREGAAELKNDFLRECHLWSTLRHPTIVQFLGIYYPSVDESGLPIMVLEKMQDSLTSLIEKRDNIPLPVKLSILHDVSLGLRYLHTHNPVVIHQDLSPNNILVTSHLEAKITDLGVAKVMTTTGGTRTMTKTPGTSVFMPPEALDDKPVYGPPLDVFSFGGVILYVASRQWPTPKSWSQIDPQTNKRIFLSEVERRQQYIDIMTGSIADLKPMVTSCLEDVPKLRPSVANLSERLKKMKEACKTTHDGMEPNCSKPCYVEKGGHDFCGKSHAVLYKQTMPQQGLMQAPQPMMYKQQQPVTTTTTGVVYEPAPSSLTMMIVSQPPIPPRAPGTTICVHEEC